MKATGIVRRIDDLGRIDIPKEICRTPCICGGEPLQIDRSGERSDIKSTFPTQGISCEGKVAFCIRLGVDQRISFTTKYWAPAALAAAMPWGESSKMTVFSGLEEKCSIAMRKPSGAGLFRGISAWVRIRSKTETFPKSSKISYTLFRAAVLTSAML